MPSQLFSVVPDSHYIVLQLQVSSVDVDACEEMQAVLAEQTEGDNRPVILDLSRAKFLPSLAIGSLVSIRRRLDEHGRSLTIVGLAPNIRPALDITRLSRGFHLAETLQDAAQQDAAS